MPSRPLRFALQLLVPAVLLAALALGVRQPIGEPPQQAKLLVLGRMVGERVRVCRDLTPEERARIPLHMQAAGQHCEQSLLPYRLQLWIDGQPRVNQGVRPAGVRGDRPVYVHQELLLPPGTVAVRIAFDPEPLSAPGTAETNPARAKALSEAVARATHYPLEQTFALASGQVVRIELDEGRRQWVVR